METSWFEQLDAPVFKRWLKETLGWDDRRSVWFCLLVLGRMGYGEDAECTLGVTPLCSPHPAVDLFLETIDDQSHIPTGKRIMHLDERATSAPFHMQVILQNGAAWTMNVTDKCKWPCADYQQMNNGVGNGWNRGMMIARKSQCAAQLEWRWPGLFVGRDPLFGATEEMVHKWNCRWLVPFSLSNDSNNVVPDGLCAEAPCIVAACREAYRCMRTSLFGILAAEQPQPPTTTDPYLQAGEAVAAWLHGDGPTMQLLRWQLFDHLGLQQSDLLM